jgi:hypothetical protein
MRTDTGEARRAAWLRSAPMATALLVGWIVHGTSASTAAPSRELAASGRHQRPRREDAQ